MFALGLPNRSGGFELRSSIFKGSSSPKDISVISRGSSIVSVFEGFLDFLSAAKLSGEHFSGDDIIVLNSIYNIVKAMELKEKHKSHFLFLDNDDSGRKAVSLLMKKFPEASDMSHLYANAKDLNEKLVGKVIQSNHNKKGRGL
ncbi:MAG: toprim domain-containing protein [Cyclobacteriaceae bacterium]|nr:toprim domain-containing protein [Cyclobacteriaceae bacterium]